MLLVTNWATNLHAMWEEPTHAHVLHRLAAVGRLILFDKRGSGVSDPAPLAARIMAAAGPSEVLVSGTLTDLVVDPASASRTAADAS